MKSIKYLLGKDFVYRLAEIYWHKWSHHFVITNNFLISIYCEFRGKALILLWASDNGIPDAEAPLKMARRLGLNLSVKQRILFSEKAKSIRIGVAECPGIRDLPAGSSLARPSASPNRLQLQRSSAMMTSNTDAFHPDFSSLTCL